MVAAKGALRAAKWAGWRGELTVGSKAAWLVDMTAGCWAELTGTRWAARKAGCSAAMRAALLADSRAGRWDTPKADYWAERKEWR